MLWRSAVLEVDKLFFDLNFCDFRMNFTIFANLSTSMAARPSMLAVSTEIHFQSCFELNKNTVLSLLRREDENPTSL